MSSTVDRETARAIAETYLRETYRPRIRAIRDASEVNLSGIYRPAPLDHCWVALVQRDEIGLRSSLVVIVDKVSGRIVYSGSLNDEG